MSRYSPEKQTSNVKLRLYSSFSGHSDTKDLK